MSSIILPRSGVTGAKDARLLIKNLLEEIAKVQNFSSSRMKENSKKVNLL